MYYAVKAKLIEAHAAEFYRKLTDGTIRGQKPEGREIVESMRRAKLTESGIVCWSEVCYCPTPLRHERETVYDHHFTHIETEEIDDYIEFEGRPLMEYLAEVQAAH